MKLYIVCNIFLLHLSQQQQKTIIWILESKLDLATWKAMLYGKSKDNVQVCKDCRGWLFPTAWLSRSCDGEAPCLLKVNLWWNFQNEDFQSNVANPDYLKRSSWRLPRWMLPLSMLLQKGCHRIRFRHFLGTSSMNNFNSATERLPDDKVAFFTI